MNCWNTIFDTQRYPPYCTVTFCISYSQNCTISRVWCKESDCKEDISVYKTSRVSFYGKLSLSTVRYTEREHFSCIILQKVFTFHIWQVESLPFPCIILWKVFTFWESHCKKCALSTVWFMESDFCCGKCSLSAVWWILSKYSSSKYTSSRPGWGCLLVIQQT